MPAQEDEAELLGAALQLSLQDDAARRERQQRVKAAASPLRPAGGVPPAGGAQHAHAPTPPPLQREAYVPQSMAAMSPECAPQVAWS